MCYTFRQRGLSDLMNSFELKDSLRITPRCRNTYEICHKLYFINFICLFVS